MPKSSFYLSAADAERMKTLGITPSEAVQRGLAAIEADNAESPEAMMRRVVREELEAWFGPKDQKVCE